MPAAGESPQLRASCGYKVGGARQAHESSLKLLPCDAEFMRKKRTAKRKRLAVVQTAVICVQPRNVSPVRLQLLRALRHVLAVRAERHGGHDVQQQLDMAQRQRVAAAAALYQRKPPQCASGAVQDRKLQRQCQELLQQVVGQPSVQHGLGNTKGFIGVAAFQRYAQRAPPVFLVLGLERRLPLRFVRDAGADQHLYAAELQQLAAAEAFVRPGSAEARRNAAVAATLQLEETLLVIELDVFRANIAAGRKRGNSALLSAPARHKDLSRAVGGPPAHPEER